MILSDCVTAANYTTFAHNRLLSDVSYLGAFPPLRQGEIDEPRSILLKPTLPTQLRLSFSLSFSIGRRSDSFDNAERVE